MEVSFSVFVSLSLSLSLSLCLSLHLSVCLSLTHTKAHGRVYRDPLPGKHVSRPLTKCAAPEKQTRFLSLQKITSVCVCVWAENVLPLSRSSPPHLLIPSWKRLLCRSQERHHVRKTHAHAPSPEHSVAVSRRSLSLAVSPTPRKHVCVCVRERVPRRLLWEAENQSCCLSPWRKNPGLLLSTSGRNVSRFNPGEGRRPHPLPTAPGLALSAPLGKASCPFSLQLDDGASFSLCS